jgi:hypothetical protein
MQQIACTSTALSKWVVCAVHHLLWSVLQAGHVQWLPRCKCCPVQRHYVHAKEPIVCATCSSSLPAGGPPSPTSPALAEQCYTSTFGSTTGIICAAVASPCLVSAHAFPCTLLYCLDSPTVPALFVCLACCCNPLRLHASAGLSLLSKCSNSAYKDRLRKSVEPTSLVIPCTLTHCLQVCFCCADVPCCPAGAVMPHVWPLSQPHAAVP